ncbi:MAG: hypothetical protein A3G24_03560 [Betaproteobacteria bacterium RIFCSPLOWO2_12_FULL_62_13]|nr:MAG: hypothetical protein A3G24_03560 [Betaproteobacteria bacterium RIFCSPLOWO2_12_FULL_62_13]
MSHDKPEGHDRDRWARLGCHAQWYANENTESFVHGVSQAFQKRALPRAFMSDNGAPMTAAEFKAGMHELGIVHETTLPYSPYQKYEAEGGATFRQAFESLTAARQPAVAQARLLRWLIFNYLAGNSEAHAKNISFLARSDGLVLAPFYDLLCVKVYGDHTMAMTTGEERQFLAKVVSVIEEHAKFVLENE